MRKSFVEPWIWGQVRLLPRQQFHWCGMKFEWCLLLHSFQLWCWVVELSKLSILDNNIARRDEASKGRGKWNYLKEHRVAISEMSTSLHAQKQVISSTFLSCWWQLPKCIEQNIAGAGEIHYWFKKSFQFWTLTLCRYSCIILYGRWYIPHKFEKQVSLILSF
jgi:hypothetical protein